MDRRIDRSSREAHRTRVAKTGRIPVLGLSILRLHPRKKPPKMGGHIRDGGVDAPAGACAFPYSGLMLWLTRNRFPGSYLRLAWARRA